MAYGIMLLRLGGIDMHEWLETYDPDYVEEGAPTYPTGRGSSTLDPAKAMRFETGTEAWNYYRQQSKVVPTRPDGKPNRPLTAFTVMIEPLPEPEDK